MGVSAGFLVVLFVALCLVVGPSIFFAIKLWAAGLWGRISLIFSCLFLGFLAVDAFSSTPDFGVGDIEGTVAIFMGVWGFFLYLALGLTAIVSTIRHLRR
jgi:hypothetical protein